jgi:lysophospholipase-2
MSMPGWFDTNQLDNLTDSRYDDEAGMMRSVAAVDALIQAEVDAGIPEDKIILGGFSQGGAISVLSGLVGKRKLGGVMGLSTWVVLNHKIDSVSGIFHVGARRVVCVLPSSSQGQLTAFVSGSHDR